MKLHLGCGDNIIPGWINLDLDSKHRLNKDFKYCDLTKRLTYENDSIDFIYSEHAIEHFEKPLADHLLRECYRILKPQGRIRISTPDLHTVVLDYTTKNLNRWHCVGWFPETPADLLNGAMRLWEHRYLYDVCELTRSLNRAGFNKTSTALYRESVAKELSNLETRPLCLDLIMEAVK
jgi:predicted SAM-dependent methyltransferase